jgi:hypothetical protein
MDGYGGYAMISYYLGYELAALAAECMLLGAIGSFVVIIFEDMTTAAHRPS